VKNLLGSSDAMKNSESHRILEFKEYRHLSKHWRYNRKLETEAGTFVKISQGS
jgi:hypothetical protein